MPETILISGATAIPVYAADLNGDGVEEFILPNGKSPRVAPRVLSAANYTTDTGTALNCDTQDVFIVTAQAGALLFNNPAGTPLVGQILHLAVTGTAARSLTFGNLYEASNLVALPTITVTTTRMDIRFMWTGTKWHILSVS